MWMYAVYCVGAFNVCQGNFYTESNPLLGSGNDTIEKCRERGLEQAKVLKFRNPAQNIVWKCIDISNIEVKEVK